MSGYSGAVFKKFKTLEQAEGFLVSGKLSVAVEKARPPSHSKKIEDHHGMMYAYTDGSHSSSTKRSGSGVAWEPPFDFHNVSERLVDGSTNQVAELFAVVLLLRSIDTVGELREAVVRNGCVIWTDSDYTLGA